MLTFTEMFTHHTRHPSPWSERYQCHKDTWYFCDFIASSPCANCELKCANILVSTI